jgi:hypothetical protein
VSVDSATVRLTRAITVAGGVFAPGHLGELTQIVPFELVDAVLKENRAVQRRLRDLPSRVGVYLVLGMGLFEQAGLALVWSKLVAGLSGLPVAAPSEKALRDLRRRVGPEPVKALFEVLAGPLSQPALLQYQVTSRELRLREPGRVSRLGRRPVFSGFSLMISVRGRATHLPASTPSLLLAGFACAVVGVEGCRNTRAAARGRGPAPRQPEAETGLD